MSYSKYICIFILSMILLYNSGHAAKSSVNIVTWRPDIYLGGGTILYDPLYEEREKDFPADYVSYRNTKVRLFYERSDNSDVFANGPWYYKIEYNLHYGADWSTANVEPGELFIKFGCTGEDIYDAINVHTGNYPYAYLEVTNILAYDNCDASGSPLGSSYVSSVIPNDIGLELIIETERFAKLSTDAVIVDYHQVSQTPPLPDKKLIKWNYIEGAEEYDVEWVFIDDEAVDVLGNPLSSTFATAEDAFDAKEPVRVTVTGHTYELDMNYPKGKLYFRVRAVGRFLTNTDYIRNGAWGYKSAPVTTGTDSFEKDKIWNFVANYAEEGKYKAVMSYYDGTYRSRQQLTNLSTSGHTVVAETKYDHEGRPAVNILPVPLNERNLAHHNKFSQNQSAESFDKDDFEVPDINKLPLNTLDGAGQYYSSNHIYDPENGINEEYIPDAQGYVYSQVEYTRDNTGRIKRQSGIGPDYVMGSEKETKFFYGTTNATELQRMFGTNVGKASHYKKNFSIDPNGQINITYLDQEGRTIATALDGPVPENLKPLEYDGDHDITVSLNDNNVMDYNNLVSTSVNRITNVVGAGDLAANGTEYKFSYDLTGVLYTTLDEGFCVDCEYTLEITITDPDGLNVTIEEDFDIISNPHIEIYDNGVYRIEISNNDLVSCSTQTNCPTAGGEDTYDAFNETTSTDRYLMFSFFATKVGIYTIEKKLKVKTEGIDDMLSNAWNDYLTDYASTSSSGNTLFEDILADQVINEDFCNYTCGQHFEDECFPVVCPYNPNGDSGPGNYFSPSDETSALLYDDFDNWDPVYQEDYYQEMEECAAPYCCELMYEDICLYGEDGQGGILYFFHGHWHYDDSNEETYLYENYATWPTTVQDELQIDLDACYEIVCENGISAPVVEEAFDAGCDGLYNLLIQDVIPNGINGAGFHYEEPAVTTNPLTIVTGGFWDNVNDLINSNVITISGLPAGEPERIAFLSTDINWNDSWAEELVKAHREYCHYERCLETQDSRLFDFEMAQISGWEEAYNLGYLNPLNIDPGLYGASTCSLLYVNSVLECIAPDASFTLDPVCTNQIYTNNSPYNILRGRMSADYDGYCPGCTLDLSIWETTEYYSNLLWTANSSMYISNNITSEDQLKWIIFQGLYRGLKAEVLQSTVYSNCGYFADNNGHVPDPHIGISTEAEIEDLVAEQSNLFNGYYSPYQQTDVACDLKVREWNDILYECAGATLTTSEWNTIKDLLYDVCYAIDNVSNPLGIITNDIVTDAETYGTNDGTLLGALWGINQILPSSGASDPSCSIELLAEGDYNYEMDNGNGTTHEPELCWDIFDDCLYEFLDFVNTNIYNSGNTNFNQVTYSEPCSRFNGEVFQAEYPYGIKRMLTSGYCSAFVLYADDGTGSYYIMDESDVYQVENPKREPLCPLLPPGYICSGIMINVQKTDGEILEAYVLKTDASCITLWDTAVYEHQCEPLPVEYTNDDPEAQMLDYTIDDWQQDCLNDLDSVADYNAHVIYQQAMEDFYTEFLNNYFNKCMNIEEDFYYSYKSFEQLYTLYYYDQAGNLVQTVPPKGVNLLDACSTSTVHFINGVLNANVEPTHTLITKYKYNSLNQLVLQETPDAGQTKFFYNDNQQLRFSQNAQQTFDTRYSFTKYDNQGRIIEVGESNYDIANLEEDYNINDNEGFPVINSNVTDYVQTIYDDGGTLSENCRGRIVSTTRYEDSPFDANYNYYTQSSTYSYDIHGNVKKMTLYNPMYGADPFKTLQYDYDLISGNVNEVCYQNGKPDMFIHKYEYDADNRITNVYTSQDGIIWDQDAKYFYYLHGPLARVEIGHDKVQGTDYAYTIQGWLKGANSNTLAAGNDIGKDALIDNTNKNRYVPRDLYGFSLSYFNGDYNSIRTFSTGEKFLADGIYNLPVNTATTPGYKDLYNGNISGMVTSVSNWNASQDAMPQASIYYYDQLNRIVSMEVYDNDIISDNTWAATSSATNMYKTTYEYDENGNIYDLHRYDQIGAMIDDLFYKYDYNCTDPTSYNYPHSIASPKNTNGLNQVDDNYNVSTVGDIHGQQSDGNYIYDKIGNLISDASENITEIDWNSYGKINYIKKSGVKALAFAYDGMGNRSLKVDYEDTGNIYTFYIRDAQGNIMATYTRTGTGEAVLNEQYMYGSSRIGLTSLNLDNDGLISDNGAIAGQGYAQFELAKSSTPDPDGSINVLVNGVSIISAGIGWNGIENTPGQLVQAINSCKSSPIDFVAELESLDAETAVIGLYTAENTSAANSLPISFNTSGTGFSLNVTKELAGGSETMQYTRKLGRKRYEFTNHLGNVLTVLSDKRHYEYNDMVTPNGWLTMANVTLTQSSPTNVNITTQDQYTGALLEVPTSQEQRYFLNVSVDMGSATGLGLAVYSEAMNLISDMWIGNNQTIRLSFIAEDSKTYIKFYSQTAGTVTYHVNNWVISNEGQYVADIKSVNDYYPFGMLMPGRQYNSPDYRFGFNGQEKDDEWTGMTGSHLDFGARIYDSRISQFLSIDPKAKDYPYMTPYCYAANSPILFIDEDGEGPIVTMLRLMLKPLMIIASAYDLTLMTTSTAMQSSGLCVFQGTGATISSSIAIDSKGNIGFIMGEGAFGDYASAFGGYADKGLEEGNLVMGAEVNGSVGISAHGESSILEFGGEQGGSAGGFSVDVGAGVSGHLALSPNSVGVAMGAGYGAAITVMGTTNYIFASNLDDMEKIEDSYINAHNYATANNGKISFETIPIDKTTIQFNFNVTTVDDEGNEHVEPFEAAMIKIDVKNNAIYTSGVDSPARVARKLKSD